MKNIQVIDDADNCSYSIYSIDDEDFQLIFPNGQDIEFSTDFYERVGEKKARSILEPVWNNRLEKTTIQGIHGTLFYNLDYKKAFYPNKCESDFDVPLQA